MVLVRLNHLYVILHLNLLVSQHFTVDPLKVLLVCANQEVLMKESQVGVPLGEGAIKGFM